MDRPHRSVHVGVVHFWQQAAVGVLDEVSLDHADRLEVGEVAVVPQLDGGGGEGGGGDGGDGGGWEGGGGEGSDLLDVMATYAGRPGSGLIECAMNVRPRLASQSVTTCGCT